VVTPTVIGRIHIPVQAFVVARATVHAIQQITMLGQGRPAVALSIVEFCLLAPFPLIRVPHRTPKILIPSGIVPDHGQRKREDPRRDQLAAVLSTICHPFNTRLLKENEGFDCSGGLPMEMSQ
ncbi:MAG: hypothetical protein ACK55I_19155, partial [bacterium]